MSVNDVLRGTLDKFVLVYLDDILIFSLVCSVPLSLVLLSYCPCFQNGKTENWRFDSTVKEDSLDFILLYSILIIKQEVANSLGDGAPPFICPESLLYVSDHLRSQPRS